MTEPARAWTAGDHLTHRFNPELGVGRVTAVEGRALVVHFDKTRTTLRIAANSDALMGVLSESGIADPGYVIQAARGVGDPASVPAADPTEAELRTDIQKLLSIRQADGLGTFLGGRVRLFPHQLFVAERATSVLSSGGRRTTRASQRPVRWLLADEVGLGKTIEACLILNRLVHSGKVERCLVVAPDSLTVQWLGELWRKYHQVFALLDGPRLADVARDFGAGFNPFDVHRRAVIALETLIERPQLTEQAVSAGIDLLVVDEAQRIRRPPGHPGEAGWRAVAPIAALGGHVLLLSATPLEDDAHGFFRLLQLLRPEEFPDDVSFEDRLANGVPLPPCTSSTRRSDIGGLPPRVGIRIALAADAASKRRHDVEATLRGATASNAVERRQKIERIRRAAAAGAALASVLTPQGGLGAPTPKTTEDRALLEQAQAMDATDPRIQWLLANAPRWRAANEKTLIFVAHRETLEMLRTALSHRGQLASGVFHEELSPARRDTEVARFREVGGPSILVSTEAGGEGRNFEFCSRLVLFDLPWKPTVVEQRIGRLDRIGRQIPVEIVYFSPPNGIGADVVRLFEALGVFREPLAGLEPQLAHVEAALEEIALDPAASLTDQGLDALIGAARAARTRIREAAYQQLHRDPYRADMSDAILARVPAELDELTERVIVNACTRLGFRVEHVRGRRTFAIEFGNEAVIESLPGVPGGSSFVGSFDREEAVADESIDFFASGHPLVEGVLAWCEDAARGV